MIRKIILILLLVAVAVSAREYVYLTMNGESVGSDTTVQLSNDMLYEFVGTGSEGIRKVSMYIKDTSMADSSEAIGDTLPKAKITFVPIQDAEYELDIIGYEIDGEEYVRSESQKFYLVVGKPEDEPSDEQVPDQEAPDEEVPDEGQQYYHEYVHIGTGDSVLISEDAITPDFLGCYKRASRSVARSDLDSKNHLPVYDRTNPPPGCDTGCSGLTDISKQCQAFYDCRKTGSVWLQTRMENRIRLGLVDAQDVHKGGGKDDLALLYNFHDSRYYFLGPKKGDKRDIYYKEDVFELIEGYYEDHGTVPCYVFQKVEQHLTTATDNLPYCKKRFKQVVDRQLAYPYDHEGLVRAFEEVENSCADNLYGALAMLNIARLHLDWGEFESADSKATLAYESYAERFPSLKKDMLYLLLQVKDQRGLCKEFELYYEEYDRIDPGGAESLRSGCDGVKRNTGDVTALHFSGYMDDKLDILLMPDGFRDESRAMAKLEEAKDAILNDPVIGKYKDRLNIFRVKATDLAVCSSLAGDVSCFTSLTEDYRKYYCPNCETEVVVSDQLFRSKALIAPASLSGGYGNAFVSVPYNKGDISRVVVHEFGHSVFGLQDEYIESGKGSEPGTPNCADSVEQANDWWAGLIPEGSLYMGCSYTDDNVRSTLNSMMRHHDEDPYPGFGTVNELRIKEVMEGYS